MITKSGVGAHHQNGVAEWAIGTVQAMACAVLLHVQLHWPDEFNPSLWPFALDYSVEIYNNLPSKVKNGLCPEEVFADIILTVVYSNDYVSLAVHVMDWTQDFQNLRTGRITPQFHVVFDKLFHTVTTEMEINLEETWIDLFRDSRDYYIQNDNPGIDPPIVPLDEEWESQKQHVEVPVVETVPEEQNMQPGYVEVEFAAPQQMEEA